MAHAAAVVHRDRRGNPLVCLRLVVYLAVAICAIGVNQMRAAVTSRAHDAEVGRVIAEQTSHSRNPVIVGTGTLGSL